MTTLTKAPTKILTIALIFFLVTYLELTYIFGLIATPEISVNGSNLPQTFSIVVITHDTKGNDIPLPIWHSNLARDTKKLHDYTFMLPEKHMDQVQKAIKMS